MLMTIINEIYYVMKLHLLWILFTVLGLVIIGIGPATLALYSCLRDHMIYQKDAHVFNAFKKSYLSAFKGEELRNVLIIYVLSGLLVVDYFMVIPLVENGGLLKTVSFVFLFFLLSLFVFMIPTVVHFDLKGTQKIIQPFIFMLISPFEWFLSVCIFSVTIVLYVNFPGLMLFVGSSLPAYCLTYVLLRRFTKIVLKYDGTARHIG